MFPEPSFISDDSQRPGRFGIEMPSFDITAIINLHAEGGLAVASIQSMLTAKSHAEANGISVEVLAVLDNPTDETRDVVKRLDLLDSRPITVSFADLGQSRNAGVTAADGEWIGFIDGDDLWSENWLSAAFELAQNSDAKTILHPQVNVYFDAVEQIFCHINMDDDDFDMFSLTTLNYWTSLAFAKKSTYLTVPYRETRLANQIGFEDWGWNLETIAMGYSHKCVPETLHAVRKRRGSLNDRAAGAKAMPHPTQLFRNMLDRA
jgi:glycosyltransferase involved in cell wall biosynthesis